MIDAEQRKQPRCQAFILSYACLSDEGVVFQEGMGRTLNVSTSGICLETSFEIDSQTLLFLTIALEEELVDIQGRVVYCRPGRREAMFETGVEFTEMAEQSRNCLLRFIKLFAQPSSLKN